jgi:hypothetical protein
MNAAELTMLCYTSVGTVFVKQSRAGPGVLSEFPVA